MTPDGDLDRRSLLVGASAAAGGLTLGFAIPFADAPAHAADGAPEINCWIAIAPDNTVTIRVARSEMGQGAMTVLAMLVAEELACHRRNASPPTAPSRIARAAAPSLTPQSLQLRPRSSRRPRSRSSRRRSGN